MAARKKTTKKASGKAGYKFAKASKVRTKSEVYTGIASNTGLSRKQVAGVFDALTAMIGQDLKTGPEIFALPGLAKITVVHKPASKARRGTNPFTGEEMMFKAKPARNVVKVRPLKGLKTLV